MLKKIAKTDSNKAGEGNYAIVAATYNREYTDALVEAARKELTGAKHVEILRVPGSFEIPAIASRLASMKTPRFDAIICFGVIFRGKTSHAQNIAEAVSNALALLQVQSKRPIIHGVLHFENEKQARIRCFGAEHNRGIEAARTAIKMVALSRQLDALQKI
jgi:6,7-dimethyl-8-ribityllumazine synthase